MPRHFDPTLVNEPFSDPGLYVDLVFERRALLFDLGDISNLVTRKILRISDVFVTHRHMDHFAGFDHLLRLTLGREKTLRLYGYRGLIEAVAHKLAAYSWNLIEGYDGVLTFRVTEIDDDGCATIAEFSGRERFARRDCGRVTCAGGVLLGEAGLRVRATILDHGLPVLAFALEERAQINVWRNRVDALGLAVGPWLRGFKEAILAKAPDDARIPVAWRAGGGPETLPLGALKSQIMQVTAGRKIAYVVDCAYTDANVEKIIALAQGADILFIEATFLEADAEAARQRRHLTARQAGTLARLCGAKRLATLHHSPRYRGQRELILSEANAAFQVQ